MPPSRRRRPTRAIPFFAIAVLSLCPPPASADWSERENPVWQDGGTIHAMAWADTEENAERRARDRFAAALRSSLPDLDLALADRSAVVGDRRIDGDQAAVRLDFPARFGEACRSALTWYQRGQAAKQVARDDEALHAFAHAAWQAPTDAGAVDTLGVRLAGLGFWGSAAMLYDAAARVFDAPPASLLRNRAAVHILMRNAPGARRALDDLRAFDPSDPDLSSLESSAYDLQPGVMRLNENEVMTITQATMDAELTTRFLAWSMLDENTRRGLIDADLAGDSRRHSVTMGPLQFDDAWGEQDEHGRLVLTAHGDQRWVVGARRLEETRTAALAYAGSQQVVTKLVENERTVIIGDLFPLGSMPLGDRFDEGWLRAVYHAREEGQPDRLRMIVVFRWKTRLYRIDLDGPLGTEDEARPGMLTAPQLVHMLLAGVHPTKKESDR